MIRQAGLSALFNPSTDWMRPTAVMDNNLIFLELILHVNLLQKHPPSSRVKSTVQVETFLQLILKSSAVPLDFDRCLALEVGLAAKCLQLFKNCYQSSSIFCI